MTHWGYGSENGPQTWSQTYPTAAGERQSPVDISPDAVKPLHTKKLTWKYIPEIKKSLKNNGHSWMVTVNGFGSELTGGPLNGKYILEQFHCHWGDNDKVGSEHTINGKTFAGELHLVHWNTKYSAFEEAAKHPDGLCVLGVFLQPGRAHQEMAKVVSKLDGIQHKNQNSDFPVPLDPARFIPQDSDYFTYQGSLTTPPCSECVIWIVFKEPVEVSNEQLNAFRSLKSYCKEDECPCDEFEGYLKRNFRPTLPLGTRTVQQCRQ